MCSPASVKMRLMPIFCAINPERIARGSFLQLDLDVHARREVELHELLDGLRGGVDNVEHALMRAHLELLAALLVDVGRAVDREALEAGGQRDGPTHLRARALGSVHDLARR